MAFSSQLPQFLYFMDIIVTNRETSQAVFTELSRHLSSTKHTAKPILTSNVT